MKREIYSLNICSDVIESMFGKYKSPISTNQLVGISTICLELPLCHMNLAQLTAQIIPSMEWYFVEDINSWKKGQNVNNQAVKRRIPSKANRRNLTFEQPRADLCFTMVQTLSKKSFYFCVLEIFALFL